MVRFYHSARTATTCRVLAILSRRPCEGFEQHLPEDAAEEQSPICAYQRCCSSLRKVLFGPRTLFALPPVGGYNALVWRPAGALTARTALRGPPMQFATVIGTLVASQKYTGLEGVKMLVVQPLDRDRHPVGEPVIAADATAQAGPGELVFIVASREAALALPEPFVPVDHAVVGIVDEVELEARS